MERQILVLGLEDSLLGLEVSSVKEIVRCEGLTGVPGAPAALAGLIALQGTLLPVFDLNVCLKGGKRDNPGGGAVIVLKNHSEAEIGIIVDAVEDIIEVKAEEILAPPMETETGAGEYVAGMVRHRGGLLILLDMGRLLSETLRAFHSGSSGIYNKTGQIDES